jgi:hypothetical protein
VLCLTDERVVGFGLLDRIRELVPQWRRGWVTQQLVKMRVAMTSQFRGSLILDADTVILKPRAWLCGDGIQILPFAHEYHPPYVRHARRMWGLHSPAVSCVTRHQLMQADVLRSMFPSGDQDFFQWLDLGDWDQTSAVAVYHDYGAWMMQMQRSRVVLAKWGNRGVRRASLLDSTNETSQLLRQLRENFSESWSLRFHSYMK